MGLQFSVVRKTFHFRFDARTSRGRMPHKTSWFVVLRHTGNPSVAGIGECGPLAGLSIESPDKIEQILEDILSKLNNQREFSDQAINGLVPPEWSAVRFALETAWLDYRHGGRRLIFDNAFISGKPIPINGLIWMGDLDFMLRQVAEKIAQGYTVLKIKVGGLDFERECEILEYIRRRYYRENPVIRLDANGAFKPAEALLKLKELSRFRIHSIEQPVAPKLDVMEEICRESPIPVALDEELIGIADETLKRNLLRKLKPAYLILKPSLHGGLSGCASWISLAEQHNIGWWITSALESSIGLNAICQFTAQYPVTCAHGLGTGQIYENNFPSPLHADAGMIRYDAGKSWELHDLLT
mgnify:FL=1